MFLGLWLGSAVLTFTMDLIQQGRLYKDACDNGYFILTSKMEEVFGDKHFFSNTLINYLIPGYNFYYLMNNTMKFNQMREDCARFIINTDYVEEMSNKDKEKYMKKPTIFNAIKMSIMNEVNKQINKELEVSEEEKDIEKNVPKFDEFLINEMEKAYKEGKISKNGLDTIKKAVSDVKNNSKDDNEFEIQRNREVKIIKNSSIDIDEDELRRKVIEEAKEEKPIQRTLKRK